MEIRKLLVASVLAISTITYAPASLAQGAPAQRPPPAPPPPRPANADQLIAQAKMLARTDLRDEYQSLCEPTPATIAVRKDRSPGVVTPTKVFDNVYYVGKNSVGATIFKTSAGLILVDTMSNQEEASTVLVPGMRQLGLDPKDIKYVIITHAHGDHSGGVPYMRTLAPDFKTVMAAADWAANSSTALRRAGDVTYDETMDLKLGDTTVKLVKTPGHTAGTTSLLFPAMWQGKTHQAMLWGGGVPHDYDFKTEVVESFFNRARAAHTEIRWQNHTKPDTRAMLAKVQAGQGNPFIFGEEKFGRYMDIMLLCKRAGIDAG